MPTTYVAAEVRGNGGRLARNAVSKKYRRFTGGEFG